ncbi:probable cyclic nucleotide-gated ion channel 20, chloroplastic isoform X2 [Sesamum indicum]|uniref:Probable cyclic nucleotide-gated ion channel 20, chloroplastic isoform X2 n=1 Tax=Sesamum indicum TaxID=4182 RepID=A0A8M8V4F5_SESIN|nr:probable cyclic nucleotide-gated ion channel 20, chloroplastic isoform X2 [Sesamum indicum]
MDASERDEIPMLSATYFQADDPNDSTSRSFSTRTRSASMSIPMTSLDSSGTEHNLVGFTGPLRNERRSTTFVQMSGPLYVKHNHEFIFQRPEDALQKKTPEPKIERYPSIDRAENNDWPLSDYAGKNEHLLKSGQLGMCNDPYCTTCPTYYDVKGRQKHARTSEIFDAKDNKCIVLNWPLTTTLVVLRSMTDFIYVFHILLQFRLAYVAPESTVTGAGDLVDDPKEIARHYFFGYFILDFFIVLPLPQIIILMILPDSMGASGANYAKNLLQAAILIQYIPRLCRFLPLVAGFSPTGFIFESSWSNFFVNLFTFVLAGHVVGSCWYLFGLQRVNHCFRDACRNSNITMCMEFIDCGHGNYYGEFEKYPAWKLWKSNENATACFKKDGFDFGIYETAVNLTTRRSLVTKYVYSFFWGFQQISTLAGNQVPSYFVYEVLFTMAIIGIGLLLFALLIGNMQNFLQALGRRRLEMSLRRRDVEQWMSHRRLPEQLRRQVRDSERFNWAATRGVNEEMLMENLPEDLQRDIRRHLFKFVKKVRIFQLLDEPIMDAICERLRTKTYIKGSKILFRGGLVDKMVFIIRGKMESIGEDMIVVPLSEGDACGEELLTWCLEHSSINKDGKRIRIPGHRLLSNRLVRCVTNVEAFVLRAVDLEEVTSLFARFLRSPRVQGAIRYESPYWRGIAARRIQVAWRYRKKRMGRADSSSPPHN